jgi:hypothetical protein
VSFNSANAKRSKTGRLPSIEGCTNANQDKLYPVLSPQSSQNLQPETIVVVLGVMYPSLLPQLAKTNPQPEHVPLPPGLVVSRQSVEVVFYDPLSSSRSGDEPHPVAKYRRNFKSLCHPDRAEARKAVASDLALLTLGGRR